MKRITSLLLLLGATLSSYAQQVLTLDSCRALALANNKELRISQEKVNAAHYEKKAAFTNYLPKIDLTGGYMRTQKEISLLSDEQNKVSAILVLPQVLNCKNKLNNLPPPTLY